MIALKEIIKFLKVYSKYFFIAFIIVFFLVKNFKFINYYGGYYAFLGALIAACATVYAIYATNKTTRQKWLQEDFIKEQNKLIIKLNKILLTFHNRIDEFFELHGNKSFSLSKVGAFINEYENKINELRTTYHELLETYNFEIPVLTSVLQDWYELEKYLENIVQNEPERTNETTIVLPDKNNIKSELCDYLGVISFDFLKARNRLIEIIQNKLG